MLEFRVNKVLGYGSFATVFQAIPRRGADVGQSYALRHFDRNDDEALKCALREHHILTRVAMETEHANFLPTLFYSFVLDKSPILVVSKASGFDLSDVLAEYFPLNLKDALFYFSEVTCGLECLHSLGIVHMDIKPENILLTNSGHIMITDFNCSYDMIYGRKPPQPEDFRGTIQYMAPEVKDKCCISFKSDTWSMAATLARMVSDYLHPNSPLDQLSSSERIRGGFESFGEPLQSFFITCFRRNPNERPGVEEIKHLELFRNTNWNTAASLGQKPPNHIWRISSATKMMRRNMHSWDEQLLRKLWKGQLDFTVDMGNDGEKSIHQSGRGRVAEEADDLIDYFSFVNYKVFPNKICR